MGSVIENEKRVVGWMIGLYCRAHHHSSEGLCERCQALYEYAQARLEACRYGDAKGSCRRCPRHCYRPGMRELIRKVMRYSGPRMILHHPVAAARHLFHEKFGKNATSSARMDDTETKSC